MDSRFGGLREARLLLALLLRLLVPRPLLLGLLILAATLLGAHDPALAGADQREHLVAAALHVLGETSDSRHRRSSGSVFEGRTLKCQSS